MCGLVGLWSKKNKPVGQQVFELYKRQDKRGKRGFGYVAISEDYKIVSVKRSKDEDGIKKQIMKEKAPIIMFHHRWPTSTENTLGTTHPILVSHPELEYDYYVAHNGVLSNEHALKKTHDELGYQYVTEFDEELTAVHKNGRREVIATKLGTFNDSEAFAIELARHLEDKSDTIDAKGKVAFWAVQVSKDGDDVKSIYYGHNYGRELTSHNTKKYHGISSINGAHVPEMLMYSYDKGDKQLYQQDFPIEDCKPTVTAVSTQVRTGGSHRVMTEYEKERMRNAFQSLENKHYTWGEAFDFGISMDSFKSVYVDGVMYYIPKKFNALSHETKPPTKKAVGFSRTQETPSDDKKQMDILEKYCEEYAALQSKQDRIEENYTNGFITESERDQQVGAVDSRMAAIEDLTSALGLDQDVVDSMLELAIQMEDYNNIYDGQLKMYQ